MPVYEYACRACGHHLEVSQSFKDEPLTECPVCGGPLRKVFNSIGVVLKGSGFYRTDARLAAKKAERSSEKSRDGVKTGDKTGDKAPAKADGKSESKAESRSESKSSDSAESKTA
jgi:putative FmdB family regulatory protein